MAKDPKRTAKRGADGPKGLAARGFAVKALRDVLKSDHQLDDALESLRASDLPAADKSFAHAIAATSLRRHGQINDVLDQFLSKPLPAKSGHARENLIAACAQMLFMDTPPHAAIDMAVHLARQDRAARHFAGLTNAVLRRVAENGEALIGKQDAAKLNIPPWMLKSWTASFGAEQARHISEAVLQEAAVDITVKSDPKKWADTLDAELLDNGSIRLPRDHGPITGLPGYEDGAWWVQDAAASLPVKLLGDIAGKRVLDLCAAPGGKTAQLAAAGAEVTAVDNSSPRMQRLADNMARLNLDVTTIVADAAEFETDAPFDAVIVDAPCSATGTLRRHPDGLHIKDKQLTTRLRPLQDTLLDRAVALTAPGGEIIYATCSLQVEEGEQVVEAALARHKVLKRQPLSKADVFGHTELINDAGDLRVLPCHTLGKAPGLDGFYAARLQRS